MPDHPGAAAITGLGPLTLTGYHGTPTSATLLVTSFDARQRLGRAAKGLLGFWGAMAVSVFLPVAHFVLVPSFFGIGMWQFFRRLRQPQLVRGARGACPDCGAEQDFELSVGLRFPQGVQCRSCQRGLTLATLDEGGA
ncbi:MAG: hypothetical protein B7X11_05760 [Acidobacteria bacterium 37-65-4]|nr:MAG: hypothetical protein B7X11_05760 [Acidobacteria bacterium 37-65-4]